MLIFLKSQAINLSQVLYVLNFIARGYRSTITTDNFLGINLS